MAPARYAVAPPLMSLPCSAHPGRNILLLAGATGTPHVPGMNQPPFRHQAFRGAFQPGTRPLGQLLCHAGHFNSLKESI